MRSCIGLGFFKISPRLARIVDSYFFVVGYYILGQIDAFLSCVTPIGGSREIIYMMS